MSQSSASEKRSSKSVLRPGVDLIDLADEESGQVEVVHGHVEERAARRSQEFERWRERVAPVGPELLDAPQLTRVDQLLGPDVTRVEPTLEADLHRQARLPPQIDDPGGLGQVEGDRLLAPDRLAGPERRLDERRVGAGRGNDHDRLDVRVVDRLDRIFGRPIRAGDAAASCRGLGTGIGDDGDVNERDGRDVTEMDLAHPARAQDGDADMVGIPHRVALHRASAVPGRPRGRYAA